MSRRSKNRKVRNTRRRLRGGESSFNTAVEQIKQYENAAKKAAKNAANALAANLKRVDPARKERLNQEAKRAKEIAEQIAAQETVEKQILRNANDAANAKESAALFVAPTNYSFPPNSQRPLKIKPIGWTPRIIRGGKQNRTKRLKRRS